MWVKYAGGEQALLQQVRMRYKEQLDAVAAVQAQIEDIYRQVNPSKLAELPGMWVKYAGGEKALLEQVRMRYKDALENITQDDTSASVQHEPSLIKSIASWFPQA